MVSQDALLWVILIIVAIILGFILYGFYQVIPIIRSVREIQNMNFQSIRPIASDLVKTVVIPDLKRSYEADIRALLEAIFKK